jgi:hypothetical protein
LLLFQKMVVMQCTQNNYKTITKQLLCSTIQKISWFDIGRKALYEQSISGYSSDNTLY